MESCFILIAQATCSEHIIMESLWLVDSSLDKLMSLTVPNLHNLKNRRIKYLCFKIDELKLHIFKNRGTKITFKPKINPHMHFPLKK